MFDTLMRARRWTLLPLLLLFAGCYEEQDVITIASDGLVHFESTVTVKDEQKKLTPEAMKEQLSAHLLSELQQSNWKVTVTWISTQRPYKMRFSGEGNLASVAKTTRFYHLYSRGEKEYTIAFLTPGVEEGTPSRSIVFKSPEGQADVFDRKGQPVSKIDSVSSNDLYAIRLH